VTVVSAMDYLKKKGYLLIRRNLYTSSEAILSWKIYPSRKMAQYKADEMNRGE
jgi:hypothetical protein